MSTTQLSRPLGAPGISPSSHRSQPRAERDLRRRLAQTKAALDASQRDNEALRRAVARLVAERRRRTPEQAPRLTASERKQRMRRALAAPHCQNP